jgi:succinyl-CoA synthetase alpha subunit
MAQSPAAVKFVGDIPVIGRSGRITHENTPTMQKALTGLCIILGISAGVRLRCLKPG